MTFVPVVMREMSVLARRKSTYRWRTALALGGVLVLAWLLMASAAVVSTTQQGKAIFMVLFSIGFVFALLAGVIVTSDCVSEEKREGTLGLLFLTDLRGYDIVLGKLTASSLSTAFALAGFVPVLALVMFLGGVTIHQVGLAAVVLAVSLFLSLAVGVFISTLSVNERKAMFAATVTMGIVTFGPYGVALFLSGFERVDEALTFISPLYVYFVVDGGGPPGSGQRYVWASLAVQWVAAVGLLYAACRILPRSVNAAPGGELSRAARLAVLLASGVQRHRLAHRAALLDRNAFLWLAARERIKPRYAWGILAVFGAIYAWIYFRISDLFFELSVAVCMSFLIHFCFKLWTASEVCSRLIQDRRSGALELLLSSPLSIREIAHGQTLALRRIFLRPVALVVFLELLLMFGVLQQPRRLASEQFVLVSFLAAITTLLLDLWALKWVGLWLSLRGKSIERVLVGTIARVLTLPWIIFLILGGSMGALQAFTGRGSSGTSYVLLWWTVSVITALGFGLSARIRFFATFRETAAQPLEAAAEEPTTSPPQVSASAFRRSRRIRRAKLAWAAVVLLFVVGGPLLRRQYWLTQYNEEMRRISAENLPVSMQGLGLYYTPVAADENTLAAFQIGSISLRPIGTRVNIYGPLGVEGVAPLATDVREKFEGVLAVNEKQLEFFELALARPKAYLEPVPEMMTTFRHEMHLPIVLAWIDAIIASENGDMARSFERILQILRFASILREQPVAQAQTRCSGALRQAAHALERLLYQHELPEELLAKLHQAIRAVDREVLARLLVVRRTLLLDTMRGAEAAILMMRGAPAPIAAIGGLLDSLGSREKGYARMLQSYRLAIDGAAISAPARLLRASELDGAASRQLSGSTAVLFSWYRLGPVFHTDAAIIARLRVLDAAIAAARHRAKHGKPPEILELLVPDLLAAVPTDPFTGEPLKHKTEGKELRIYSLGMDRRDQGGRPGYSDADVVFSLWTRDR